MKKKPRVAFVVQRCGAEIDGGAERHCFAVAERMADAWDAEILTTCALDYMTWANHFPAGSARCRGVSLRRFPVERPRDVAAFNKLSESLRPRLGTLSRADEEAWMRAQGPWTPALLEYLEKRRGDYDAFIFFTYLYATTYFGLPLVCDKAFLAPTAHDEWPIHFGIWEELFKKPKGSIFNSTEELAFLRRRFPTAHLTGPVVGVAVERPVSCSAERFRQSYGLDGRVVIYLGRIDGSKGTGALLGSFARYREKTGDVATTLLLVGKEVMRVPPTPGVRVIGFVDDQTKWDAIAASDLLVMPSPHESLSMACLEAWSLGKPVLVNGAAEVLVGQCRRSDGGLWYGGDEEFALQLGELLASKRLRDLLGERGRAFVSRTYDWQNIKKEYRALLEGNHGNHFSSEPVMSLSEDLSVQQVEAIYRDVVLKQEFYGEAYGAEWQPEPYRDLSRTLEAVARPKTHLDVGCGKGYLVAAMRDRGLDSHGIDFSSAVIGHAPPDVRPFLSVGTVEEWAERGDFERISLLTFCEVFEHLPISVIAKLLAKIRGVFSGVMFLTIPSYGLDSRFGLGIKVGADRPEWARDMLINRPLRNIVLENGLPHLGHITLASYRWWSEFFLFQGFVRERDMEQRCSREFRDVLVKYNWHPYFLRRDGRTTDDPFDLSSGSGLGDGWHDFEDNGRWTDGSAVVFLPPRASTPESVRLVLSLPPANVQGAWTVAIQIDELLVDESFRFRWQPRAISPLTEVRENDIKVRVEPSMLMVPPGRDDRDGSLRRFRMVLTSPRFSPANLGISMDDRQLGLFVHSVRIS